ncbi:hypothetical protein C8R44DRAFT_726132 [Mycena epipterygia]|nr:hypothetical protein C8R44DRAFT_726132 [Mycena epipterygia]
MADPITVTTTLITLATFIKDLIDLGQSIKSSIEKASLASVGENRRRIRDLTDDILRTLGHLADLSRGHENSFQAPELLTALGNLKADMMYVYGVVRKISSPARTRGLRGFGSEFKAWIKRDDIEGEIRRLRERVTTCYLQFTTFSAARTEHTSGRIENTSLRVEQTLVVSHVENHVRLQRLETMMARVLLETQFGQNIMNQTIEIISSDPTHQTIEFQYLSIQTLHLVDGLQELLLGRSGDLPWSTAPRTMVFIETPSPAHTLHRVLGMVLAIRTGPTEVQSESIMSILDDLEVILECFRMTSEAIAWALLKIQILRHSNRDRCAGVFPRLSYSLRQLSDLYAYQLRHDLALQSSQKAVDLSQFSSESWPHPGNQTLFVASLISHSRNLREVGKLTDAISAAEAAVAIICPMATGILESCLASGPSRKDLWIAVTGSKASFVLAAAFSSAGRTHEAYQASMQSLQNFLRFSGTIQHISPFEGDFDSFFDHLCTMAEAEDLSLEMLADCVILFRDLARIYPQEFSGRFVRVLYAYVYIGEQAATSSIGAAMKALRILVEDSKPPLLPASTDIMAHLNDFDSHGGVREDALRGFLLQNPTFQSCRVIGDFFVAGWDVATAVLRAIVKGPHRDLSQILWHILGVLGYTSHPQLRELLPIVHEIIALPFKTEDDRRLALAISSQCFWLAGALDDAIALCQEGNQSAAGPESRSTFLGWKAIALHDMGHIGAAIEAAKEAEIIILKEDMNDDETSLCYYAINSSILQRTGRHKEVLQLYLAGRQRSEVRQGLGQKKEALQDAELAVSISRQEPMDDDMIPFQMCSLTRSLATLSNCLVSMGRDCEALAAAQEAEIIYKSYRSHRSAYTLTIIPERPQEIGAGVYSCLALRLATLDQLDDALSSAETATNLYRELASLARRFLPDLASSLQTLARILWKLNRQAEFIVACEEAVNIMRQVASEELYFLPAFRDSLDQVAEYLGETGNVEAASAAATESAEVQRKFALLPAEMRESLEGSNVEGGTKHINHAEVASELPLRDSESLVRESTDIPTAEPESVAGGIQNNPDHFLENTRTRTDIARPEAHSHSTSVWILWALIGILSILLAWTNV